ncbi:glutamate formimidoyltransferase [Mucilaginibacter terrenus]|uniref:glutamate formimidoyltransferase n=1 Tax=Mucilaginibacter terrenus TaxID=2482727 RepID=A0A3E2NR73_9SPHI|nr:glutamate formimidoyltransferase [Mucilaginibacter terrenus]RFZ83495.1 glutamate formimidoyltransferase [Mucilaginibacter terrenus]
MPLIECVPNFSEGVNIAVIEQIATAIRSVPGVKLLHIDSGEAANRTVITFAGEPEPVIEAAFLAIKTAGELIDMSRQKGEHPRMGATDVCPLVPLSGITLQEVTVYAARLGRRVGEELGIPVYLYEHSQAEEKRSNLSVIRSGEYEGFFNKIKQPGWAPDFGPAEMDAQRGATVIGARNLLIAYNVNLNTTSVPIASAIAVDVRESGKKIKMPDGSIQHQPGALKKVKAIGWYIAEFEKAQVSMNLTDITIAPIHLVFEEVCKAALRHGVQVTGSELIGLIPLQVMLDAGRYFADKQHNSEAQTEGDFVAIAIQAMGLDELAPFDPQKKIIEYLLNA